MAQEDLPITITSQWPEARGFARTYGKHPDNQSRLVKALLGLRMDIEEGGHDDEAIQAIDVVISAFRDRYPEFMDDSFVPDGDVGTGPYHADERMKLLVEELSAE